MDEDARGRGGSGEGVEGATRAAVLERQVATRRATEQHQPGPGLARIEVSDVVRRGGAGISHAHLVRIQEAHLQPLPRGRQADDARAHE